MTSTLGTDSRITESRANRETSNDALEVLETAFAAPGPGRELDWIKRVGASLDTFIAAIEHQSATSRSEAGLLSQIAIREPRLGWRIDRLERELDDLKASARSLREQITPEQDNPRVDVPDIRNRLMALANRYRSHRARETDLVYEAIAVDLGESG
jgi:hypothetical protein